jgi:hypothetical protein
MIEPEDELPDLIMDENGVEIEVGDLVIYSRVRAHRQYLVCDVNDRTGDVSFVDTANDCEFTAWGADLLIIGKTSRFFQRQLRRYSTIAPMAVE